jgi:YVTN family beta-propeller protein
MWRRLLIWGFTLLLGLFVLPAGVSAHAHLIRADLAENGHLLVPAGTYRFWFDEALNPALSKIIIHNSTGTQVNTDTGTINPANTEEMDVQLPALPPGPYSVFWTSDSAQDGHILHGFYVFTVGGAGATAINTSAPATAISAPPPELDATAIASALAHWLVLIASMLWTGALALETLVLAPARTGSPTRAAQAGLAQRASVHSMTVVRLGLIAALVTNLIELEVQAYAAGGWSGLVSGTLIRGTLSSNYGTYWILRVITCILALLIIGLAPVGKELAVLFGIRTQTPNTGGRWERPAPHVPGRFLGWTMGVLGMAYLLEIALSGHAAAVSQMVFTSVLLDWMHLLASAVWIGGMGAIALALIPAFQHATAGSASDRHGQRLAFLALLDHYSPAAYIAVVTAAVTGMFNAQVHLNAFSELYTTAYGRFLLIKLACIGELLLLSASHVFLTRPRLRAMPPTLAGTPQAEEGYASLIARLRVEPLIGLLILLCVALMGQVALEVTVFTQATTTASTQSASAVATVPASIQATARKGDLVIGLIIGAPTLGEASFTVSVRESGKPVTGLDGQVRVRLSMPSQPGIGDTFVETTASKNVYSGKGDLPLTGTWRADVLVRTVADPNEFRDVPFNFLAGPGATFLQAAAALSGYGSATFQLALSQDGPSTLTVQLRPGLTVRYTVLMVAMPGMGVVDYPATATGSGTYKGQILFQMAGVNTVAIQVQSGSAWKTVRDLIYNLDQSGKATLISASQVAAPVPTAAPASAATPQAYNLSFALHLPYQALVTRMRNNTVSTLQGATVKTGLEPHGVDVVDGTDIAYVTDFLSGDVVVINWKTMAILHRIPVSLEPAHTVFTPDHSRAFVTNFLTNDVSVIDMHTYKVIGDITVGLRPHGIDISPDGRIAYVACGGAGSIYAIDTRTLKIIGQAPAGLGPLGVTVNPVNGDINVTDSVGNEVYILKPGSLDTIATIKVGKQPALMAITDDGSRLYVANQLGSSVSVINTHTDRVIATVPVGSGPHGPDITPDDKYVYVPAINSGTISIIRTSDNKVVGVIPIGEGPNEVAIDR